METKMFQYSATVPELPRLFAIGNTPVKAVEELLIATDIYLEVLKEDNQASPLPTKYNKPQRLVKTEAQTTTITIPMDAVTIFHDSYTTFSDS